jgi:hypothetical protein
VEAPYYESKINREEEEEEVQVEVFDEIIFGIPRIYISSCSYAMQSIRQYSQYFSCQCHSTTANS